MLRSILLSAVLVGPVLAAVTYENVGEPVPESQRFRCPIGQRLTFLQGTAGDVIDSISAYQCSGSVDSVPILVEQSGGGAPWSATFDNSPPTCGFTAQLLTSFPDGDRPAITKLQFTGCTNAGPFGDVANNFAGQGTIAEANCPPDWFLVGIGLTTASSAFSTISGVGFMCTDDITAPVFDPVDDITVTATSAKGAVVTFMPTATDNISAVVNIDIDCTPSSGSTFDVGSTLVSCTATDEAGNTATEAFTVTVERSQCTIFEGFFEPVTEGINLITATQTLPIKFSLGGDFGLDIKAAGYPKLISAPCTDEEINEIETDISGSDYTSAVRYDSDTDQYSFGVKLKALRSVVKGQCYNLRFRINGCTDDHDILVKVKA